MPLCATRPAATATARAVAPALALALVTATLAACGNGDGGSTVVAHNPIVAGNVSPEGIYSGTATSTNTGSSTPLVGAISPGNQVQLVDTRYGYQYSGTLAVSGTAASGTLQNYDYTGQLHTTLSVQGTVTARSGISATYTAANGDKGTISLSYSTLYESPYGLATLAGNYAWTSIRNGGQSTATVTAQGAVTGTTEFGCAFTGQLAPVDSVHDLFGLTVKTADTAACASARNATLGGLAYYNPNPGSGAAPVLQAAATSSAAGYYASYSRQ